MTEHQDTESGADAVTSLHHCGNPDIDHLIDEIQHPETEQALYEMPARPARPED
ncbi:hypothetical protein GCM10010193_59710 [Kitasatospora atroaurantiaca]|uniref:Uncharacterized protein n=1 Tax=Kitasatospora atroaurantiaca TaxID=285545 RepID=A0A561EWQ7_9ACTN|nr:hypothetical protein [Kitasatospora atroaurantiaca]TWE20038.1 hypothetical protein FB465_5180 [Kitasatospora atroaurantiaca]